MDVRGLIWIGIDTRRYGETVEFFRNVLGLAAVFENPETVEFECPNGTRVQVARADSNSCPVPLFEVADLRASVEAFEAAGTPVSEIQEDAAWQWIEVLGPSGHRYEFATRK
jgi:hypothetical protein